MDIDIEVDVDIVHICTSRCRCRYRYNFPSVAAKELHFLGSPRFPFEGSFKGDIDIDI